jgi:hypothetical protein
MDLTDRRNSREAFFARHRDFVEHDMGAAAKR